VALERAWELLDRVGLSARADDKVHTYSRGMVQRLAVCRAVLHDPEVLLLDEPRANLDPAAAELVEPLIGAASGCTRIVTSHDPAGGLAEADLALGLRAGRADLVAPAREIDTARIGALYR
jgi:heme exporter protein A